MTARLTIDYKRPTPLHTNLNFKAQLDRIDGRKIYASGKVFADDRLTATAEALFLSVNAEKLSNLYMEGQERDRDPQSFDDDEVQSMRNNGENAHRSQRRGDQ